MTGISKNANKYTVFSSSVHYHPTQTLPTKEWHILGKRSCLIWHVLLDFDVIVPYGGFLILYLNTTLLVSAPSSRLLCEIYGW